MAKGLNSVGVLELKFNLSASFFMMLFGGILVVLYWHFESYREDLKFATAVLAGMAAIYSAFFVGKNIKLNLERDMLHRSFELTGRIVTSEYNEAHEFVIRSIHNKITPAEVYKTIINDQKLLSAVRATLNNFEDISIAIQKGYADESAIYMALDHLARLFYDILLPTRLKTVYSQLAL